MVDRPGQVLVDARRAARMTQAALAERTGVSRSTISQYETGDREPGAGLWLRLLAATGADLSVGPVPVGPVPAVPVRVVPATSEQVRRGRVLSDLLRFAGELPHRWPGDRLQFPSEVWG